MTLTFTRNLCRIAVVVCFAAAAAGCGSPPVTAADSLRQQVDGMVEDGRAYAPAAYQDAQAAVSALESELQAQQNRFRFLRSYGAAETRAEAAEKAVAHLYQAVDAGKRQIQDETRLLISETTPLLEEARQTLNTLSKEQVTGLEPRIASAEHSLDQARSLLADGRFADAHAKAAAAHGAAGEAQASLTRAREDIPTARRAKGEVTIPEAVLANGKRLPAGSYQLRITGREVAAASGPTAPAERWLEFRAADGSTAGSALAVVVPGSEMAAIAESPAPSAGETRVDVLKSGDYVRIWMNRGGTFYLVHLPVA